MGDLACHCSTLAKYVCNTIDVKPNNVLKSHQRKQSAVLIEKWFSYYDTNVAILF
jgi:hypothetical protein